MSLHHLPFAWGESEIVLQPALDDEAPSAESLANYASYINYSAYNNYMPYSNYMPYTSATTSARTDSARSALLRREHFGASLCTASGTIIKMNQRGADVLRARRDGVPLSDRAGVEAFLARCVELGWQNPDQFLEVGTGPRRDDALAAPYVAYLYPSLFCNLEAECVKCYVSFANPTFRGVRMDRDHAISVVHELADAGVFQLIILGGEPLAYPHLFDVLAAARERGLFASISTNGSLVTEHRAVRLAALIDRVQVSIDGADAAAAELLKGENTFAPTLKAIRLLRQAGVPVIASCVLTPANASTQHLERLVRLCVELDLSNLSFIQYYPSGDRPRSTWTLRPDENDRIAHDVATLRQSFPSLKIDFEHSFGFLAQHPIPTGWQPVETTWRGCQCGRRRLSIYPNGDLHPCDFLAQDGAQFKVGNAFTDGIMKTWNDSPSLHRFRARDGHAVEPCEGCQFRPNCGGGCQAMTWRVNGNLAAADPRCPTVQSFAPA